MKRSKAHLLRSLSVTLIACAGLASCTQDELMKQSTALPDGVYPITFTAVQALPEETPDGTPQTRVSDNGNKSSWTNGDKINVTVTGADGNVQTTTCTLDDNGDITTYTPQLYWQTTDEYTINAWYSNLTGQSTGDGSTVSLADQRSGLAYVLKAKPITANYQTTAEQMVLNFTHQLAKIRVELTGDKAADVTSVSIESYTSCTNTNGIVSTDKASTGEIAMYQVDENTYEANVVPGYKIEKFKINDGSDWITLTTGVMPEKGKRHDITIDVKVQATDIDFSSEDVTISEDGNYRITGDHSSKNFTIQTPDGWDSQVRNTIILENTTLESIFLTETGARGMTYTTFIIKGEVNIKKGIVTKCGGEINIKGTTGSKLVITSPDSYNPAIGNLNIYSRSVALTIEDATIEATGAAGAAVIGTSSGWPGEGNVGDITIKNSNLTLTAVSDNDLGSPAVIGTGVTDGSSVSCGNITIYLKDGQSKEEFLQNLKGDYNQQVGVGSNKLGGSVSCGSISWYNSDGSPAK